MTSVAATALSNGIQSLAQYYSSNEMQVYQKDGQQFYKITFTVVQRLNLLAVQLAPLLPELVKLPFSPITLGLFAVPFLIPNSHWLKHVTWIQPVINKSDEIINVACLVSYVSLIALGFPLQGGIALTGLALIILKQNHWIRPVFDRFLRTLSAFALAASGFQVDSYVLKAIMIFGGTVASTSFILQALGLEKKWPQIAHPFHGLHNITDEIKAEIETNPLKEGETIEDWLNQFSFSINPTYIYSNHMEELLPPDYPESDYEKLFADFEAKITTSKIKLTDKENEGIEKLKKFVITGTSTQADLLNPEALRKTTASYAFSLLREEVDFESKVKTFADLGNSCEGGWDREIPYLFNPKSKDPNWAVHHVLGLNRGELIENAIIEVMRETGKGDWVGGDHNTHTANGADMFLYGKYRSYQAESYRQKFCPRLLNVLFRYLQTDLLKYLERLENTSPKKIFEEPYDFWKFLWNKCLYGTSQVMGIFLSFKVFLGFTLSDYKKFKEKLENEPLLSKPDQVIDCIYQAIKPEKQKTPDKKKVISRRIVWETIKEIWHSSFQKSHEEWDLSESSNEKLLIEKTPNGPTLSKTGVKLMLWDMGILTGKRIDSSEASLYEQGKCAS